MERVNLAANVYCTKLISNFQVWKLLQKSLNFIPHHKFEINFISPILPPEEKLENDKLFMQIATLEMFYLNETRLLCQQLFMNLGNAANKYLNLVSLKTFAN